MYESFIEFIKNDVYPNDDNILLHRPVFEGNEKEFLAECIDSNFVSSVGQRVIDFENQISKFTGAKYAIATVNGTAALHIALKLAGVKEGTDVLTQPLSFVATCNSIAYCKANPFFIDVEKSTLGLSAEKLKKFLKREVIDVNGKTVNKITGREISACVPMHTFGHPCEIIDIVELCKEYNIPVVEDSAESLGSYYNSKHTGTFGLIGIFSFNGNKIITTGGGGMIVTDDKRIAEKAKFLTTTGKAPHQYEFFHPEIAYNYRMPNLNAALGYAQLERLDEFLDIKRKIAGKYERYCDENEISFFKEPTGAFSNYWLNAIMLKDKTERDEFLEMSNARGVMTRPVWKLMNKLPAFAECGCTNLDAAEELETRLVNLPSSVPENMMER